MFRCGCEAAPAAEDRDSRRDPRRWSRCRRVSGTRLLCVQRQLHESPGSRCHSDWVGRRARWHGYRRPGSLRAARTRKTRNEAATERTRSAAAADLVVAEPAAKNKILTVAVRSILNEIAALRGYRHIRRTLWHSTYNRSSTCSAYRREVLRHPCQDGVAAGRRSSPLRLHEPVADRVAHESSGGGEFAFA